jgi:hypothetical protein
MRPGCVASHDRYGSVTLVTALVTEEYPQLWVVETDGELKIVREDELYDYGYYGE